MNNIEQIINNMLNELGFSTKPSNERQINDTNFFYYQFPFRQYILDFADPANKICIEVQGTYWHGHLSRKLNKTQRKKRTKDIIKKEILLSHGWRVIYIWEHLIKKTPNKIKQYLQSEIFKGISI